MPFPRLAIALVLTFTLPGFLAPEVAVAAAARRPKVVKKKGKKKPPPAEPAKSGAEREAERAMVEGGEAFETGDYAGALSAFARARDLIPDASGPYRAIAYTELKMGNLPGAREAFERYIEIKGKGPGVEEARKELAAVEERILAEEAAARKAAEEGTVTPELPLPPGEDGKRGGGGVKPLQIVGFGTAGAGAVIVGLGVFFTAKWLSARAAFSDEYEMVRSSLTLEPGAGSRLRVCNEADFAMFTPESQEMLEAAREHCGPLGTRRVLAPVFIGAGVAVLGAGLAIALAAGGKKAPEDPYALGPFRLSLAPTPGGAMLSASGTF